ncbi:MAG: hypothetical protein NTW60_03525 [Candidatus Wolfebacteria bacterium]|nr:hypothetical protein [Candidatus Wolfebacteria bacterium]
MKRRLKKDFIYPILSVFVLLAIIIFGGAGSQKSGSINKPAAFHSIEKSAVSYSPKGVEGGGILSASCESVYEHNPGECTTCGGWSDCSVSCGGGVQYQTCTTVAGGTYQNSQACNTQACVPTASLSANPSTIFDRDSSILSWSSTDATGCSIDNGIGGVGASGNVSVSPRDTTTYTLTCSGRGGQIQSQTTVTVNYRAPTATLTTNHTVISKGESALLTWQSSDADWCDITNDMGPDIGAVPVNGSRFVSPEETTAYTLTCFNRVGTAVSSVSIDVVKTLTVGLTADPSSGAFPLSTNLTATVGGTETGTINYSFWWNCDNTTKSVSNAMTSCGALNSPAGGGTCGAPNQYGIKCDGINSPTKTVPHTYDVSGTYKPKVIVERGTTPASEDRTLVGNCSAGTATSWSTCSATCGGGTQSRDVCNGDGTVRSEAQTCNTQSCSFGSGGGGQCSFSANPSVIGLAGNSTLSWNCPGASSCVIDQGIGNVGPSDSATIHLSQTTAYTLTCSVLGGGGTNSFTTTVNVGLVPKIIEILPRN